MYISLSDVNLQLSPQNMNLLLKIHVSTNYIYVQLAIFNVISPIIYDRNILSAYKITIKIKSI